MPSVLRIRRYRKSVHGSDDGPIVGALALILTLTAILILAAASVYMALISGLPDVSQVESQFGMRGAERFRPLLVLDNSGKHVLYEHIQPSSQSRRWIEIDSVPEYLIEATIAAVEPDFWSSPGYNLSNRDASTISERLVEVSILPPGDPSLQRSVQRALLAAELTRRYPQERILSWYLNSTDYGNAAYGLDAAALAYYGKHAEDLSLGESASLAAALLASGEDIDEKEAREFVLEAMIESGVILRAEAREARSDAFPRKQSAEVPALATFIIEQVRRELGDALLGRSGLTVTTSIDHDLQEQASCASISHIRRLSGEPIGSVSGTAEGNPCVSAALLPTLRPRDAGVNHGIDDFALIVMDPVLGEILAAVGAFNEARDPEPLLDPFTYLAAFSRGSTPASMVVDLGDPPHGPIRMRTALTNLYPYPSASILTALGEESVSRILTQMGLGGDLDSASLLDLAAAYGVLAAEGRRTGVELAPSIVRRVEDSEGTVLYEYSALTSRVVSPQLAFLMTDVLSDDSARWNELGKGNSLEIGRAAGVIAESSPDGTSNWTIGYTPQRVAGVWLGGDPLIGVDRTNGASSIWNAVMRFASADLAPQSWQMPLGVTSVEVCDPSGLLPTQYCPDIVREVFILGTEPTHYDNLFQPFRINSETGKLATLLTPLQYVEERVYFIPPAAAEEWAMATGVEQPPQEYDTLAVDPDNTPGVRIVSPTPFEILGRNLSVRGEATADGFKFFRLQYGQGLNPTRWIQIGEDQDRPVDGSVLGTWSTDGLNGLYTLQLLVVLDDGQVRTAATPITLDNDPPSIELLIPTAGETYSLREEDGVTISVSASDEVGLDRVHFFVDGRRIETTTTPPYSIFWEFPKETGEYEILARAFDTAGNRAESIPIPIELVP